MKKSSINIFSNQIILLRFIMPMIFLILSCFSCKKMNEFVEIKLLLLNSENYMNQKIMIQGKIKEVGPLNLWFILEDETGYIQVTTQNISKKMSCLKKDNIVIVNGELEQYGVHKYFSLQKDLNCV